MVHSCLGLSSVANVSPPLQQGRRIEALITTNLMECLLPGATEQQSMQNLYEWLDAIMMRSLGNSACFAHSSSGARIPGVYHHLSKEEFMAFKNNLDQITKDWHVQCLSANISAGYMVELFGGTCGRGSLLASAISIGPFIC